MNDGMIGLLIGLFMGGALGAFLSSLVIAVENADRIPKPDGRRGIHGENDES